MALPDVISLDDAIEHLNMTDMSEAAELAVHVSAASEMVEEYVGPVIVREFTDFQLDPGCDGEIMLFHRPVVALVAVAASFTGRTAPDVADLRVHPSRGTLRHASGYRLWGGPYDVTYTAGRCVDLADVPPALALAARVIVAHLWETQRAVTLGAQAGPDDFGASPVGAGFAIPYRARDLMTPYRSVVVA